MVLPKEIGDAAQDADAARVKAWLDSGGDINDGDKENYTLIHCCAIGALDDDSLEVTDAHVSLARTLIALGADVNTCNAYSETPLLDVLEYAWRGGAWTDMVKLLLQAKANPNARNNADERPLQHAIAIDHKYELSNPPLNLQTSRSLVALRMLLRAGASLDGEPDDTWPTAEHVVRGWYSRMDSDQDDERVIAMKALIAGVRKHGTYKRYMRAPHREVLSVRGLAQRGKLRTDHPVLAFLAKQGDNGVVWHILTYWRPTE